MKVDTSIPSSVPAADKTKDLLEVPSTLATGLREVLSNAFHEQVRGASPNDGQY
jgi:hypothetical protein